MRLVDKIAEDEKDFHDWCDSNGYTITESNFYKDPLYKDYEDFLDPPAEREKRRLAHEQYINKQKDMVGVLDLDTWWRADYSLTPCPKCKNVMLYISNFLLNDDFGCPACGHVEIGGW